MGIDNVNSLENLVPACEACAEKKGNRIGNWPKKAKRGLKDSYIQHSEANYEIKPHFNFWIDFIYHLFKPIRNSEV